MRDVLDSVSEGVIVTDGDWRITDANAVAADLFEREGGELVGADVRDAFPRSAISTFHERFDAGDATPVAVSFEEYYPELETWLAVRTVPDGDGDGLAVYLRDISGRIDLERELDDRKAELARLNRINGIIQEIIRELVGATSREEIERIVCERLASADLYEYVWIGERDAASDGISHRIAAGEYEGIVEFGFGDPSDDDPSDGDASDGATEIESPEEVALRTGETQVVRRLMDDETVPERVRREAFAHGLQSSVAVPFRYGNSTFGVLGVYATHPNAFSERERESLATLGETVGFVINAARQRNLLLSDTVVELTFGLSDPDAFAVSGAAQFDCEVTVQGIVPLDEGQLIAFLEVDGADPRGFLEFADGAEGVEAGRIIHEITTDGEVGGLVEVRLADTSPLLVLVEHGATVRSALFDGDGGRVVAEVAPDADIREVVETVGEAHPGTELLSKRERQREVETAQEFRSSLHDRLTDRQRTALRTAFHGGYFESPRDSTAEELAASLDISAPTFHAHLRAAEWKLLDAFFGDEPEYERLRPRADESDGEAVSDDV